MWYIDPIPNYSGAYSPPQSTSFDGAIPLTDEQLKVFLQYNGFVSIVSEDGVYQVVPNLEAWEAWKSSLPPQPEPEPTEAERLRADVDFLAAMAGVEL